MATNFHPNMLQITFKDMYLGENTVCSKSNPPNTVDTVTLL